MDNISLINELIADFRHKKIINAIKFDCFFTKSARPVSFLKLIKQILFIGRSLFLFRPKNDYVFIREEKNTGVQRKASYVTINTVNAVHYNKIESKLTEMIDEALTERGMSINRQRLIRSEQNNRVGWLKQFRIKCSALYILVSLLLKAAGNTRKPTRNLVFNDIDYLYINIVKYLLEYQYFSWFFRNNLSDFLLTINENWMPQSVVVDCCREMGIPTVIYPHGIIGSVNLPFECDRVLFWNEQMKECYEQYTRDWKQNFVIGAIEPLGEQSYSEITFQEYDVLIISQLMVANDAEHVIFKDIFRIWKLYVDQHPDFKVCIKLHPFEGEKEIAFLNELFGKDTVNITIIQGRHIPVSDLIMKSKRVSTVSSSSIQHCYHLKKPVLLYAPSEQLLQNFPVPDNWKFCSLEELNSLMSREESLTVGMQKQQYLWADEVGIKNSVSRFINVLYEEKVVREKKAHASV